jgi:hypothetical protein
MFICRLTDPAGVVKFQRSNQKNGIEEIDPVSNQGNHFKKFSHFYASIEGSSVPK